MLEAVLGTLAAELCCDRALLRDGRVHVLPLARERAARPLHRTWPPVSDPQIRVASVTNGGVVGVSPRWLPWAERHWRDVPGAIHAAQLAPAVARAVAHGFLAYGPRQNFTLDDASWRRVAPPRGVAVTVAEGRGGLRFSERTWPNAWIPPRFPTTFTATARRDGRLVAVATSARMNEVLAEVGVDVAPPARGLGIGAAVVSALARALLDAGTVPHYATGPANVRSMRTAVRVGFAPAFVDFCTYATEAARPPEAP